jgi:hypothetical protein
MAERPEATCIREQLFGGEISAGRLRDALELLRQRGEVHVESRRQSPQPSDGLLDIRLRHGTRKGQLARSDGSSTWSEV